MLKHYVALANRITALPGRLADIRNDKGVTSVEYGLMVALIAIVIIGAVTLLGTNLKSLFSKVANAI